MACRSMASPRCSRRRRRVSERAAGPGLHGAVVLRRIPSPSRRRGRARHRRYGVRGGVHRASPSPSRSPCDADRGPPAWTSRSASMPSPPTSSRCGGRCGPAPAPRVGIVIGRAKASSTCSWAYVINVVGWVPRLVVLIGVQMTRPIVAISRSSGSPTGADASRFVIATFIAFAPSRWRSCWPTTSHAGRRFVVGGLREIGEPPVGPDRRSRAASVRARSIASITSCGASRSRRRSRGGCSGRSRTALTFWWPPVRSRRRRGVRGDGDER